MNDKLITCVFEGDLVAFASSALPARRRREFLAHLVECRHCVSGLEAIAVDGKLAERDLDTIEKAKVASIVQSARREVEARWEYDRPLQRGKRTGQETPPSTVAGAVSNAAWRPLFVAFSTAAASALCLWLYSRLA